MVQLIPLGLLLLSSLGLHRLGLFSSLSKRVPDFLADHAEDVLENTFLHFWCMCLRMGIGRLEELCKQIFSIRNLVDGLQIFTFLQYLLTSALFVFCCEVAGFIQNVLGRLTWLLFKRLNADLNAVKA